MDEQRVVEANEITTPELAALQQENNALRAAMAAQMALTDKLAWLAAFPEQNPNLVIEVDSQSGRTTYLNPVAQQVFPDLWDKGIRHPLFQGIDELLPRFQDGEIDYVAREVDLGQTAFEQKVCYMPQGLLRIFAHDITARKQAEESVQELATQARRLAHQVVRAQEEERRRLSRELHDEAGQALTALRISLELLQAELPPHNGHWRESVEEMIGLTDTTRRQLRELAQGLRPPALDTVGLDLTLAELCRSFSRRTHLAISYSGTELPLLPGEVDVSLYRFVQEALTNVANHAQATHVAVEMTYDTRDGVCLIVRDNGRGFEVRPKNDPGLHSAYGLGLMGLQERLELLGGWLAITSAPEQGTTLLACIPPEEIL